METAVSSTNEAFPTSIVTNFTPEQVQHILSLIETPKSGHKNLSSKESWLPDSRASCHMMGPLSMLCDIHVVEPIPIELPHGSVTMATKR